MRIGVFGGSYGYWGQLDPDRLSDREAGGQLGGGETACLRTAMALAARGHEVFLGANVPRIRTAGGVVLVPAMQFVPAIQVVGADVAVSWDEPMLFRFNLNARLQVLAFQLNDTQVEVLDYVIDKYFHPSGWHARRFAEKYGLPESKQVPCMTNATDLQGLQVDDPPERGRRVLWASSPDRGLHHLLALWPEVQKQYPDAELHICYDMDRWITTVVQAASQGMELVTSERAMLIREQLSSLLGRDNFRVTYHGGLSKPRLRDFLLSSAIVAYPCDPVAPTEGYSMTILDSWAAGCQVLTTDADALPELWGDKEGITILPLPVREDIWTEAIINRLEDGTPPGPRDIPKEYSWDSLVDKWIEGFKEWTH